MRSFKVAVLLMLVVLVTSCSGKKEKKPEVVKVTRGNILASISSVGEVMPRNRLEIKPAVSGRIDSIFVNEGDNVKKGQILALVSSSDRAVLLDSAAAKGPEEVKYWEEVYKPSPVMAPLNGFIIKRSMEPGQSIDKTSPVLVMADHLTVKAQVDETDLGRISLGQKATIILDAYPETKIDAVVEHIAYESEQVNNVTVYKVDVLPYSVPAYFRSGMSATVNFFQGERKNILLLPSNAVRTVRKNPSVFLKTGGGKNYSVVQVKTGLENENSIEIVSGLSEEAEVLIPSVKMVLDAQDSHRGPQGPSILGGGRRQ
ncbi:MAG: efflux RND transporter periplasmic adaptor subunit [Candidatus Saganbacteria bacterium]|nr:efflux RND transporter periplasmic adaptor subunit [Candidatus Saganbacteria bacterium]